MNSDIFGEETELHFFNDLKLKNISRELNYDVIIERTMEGILCRENQQLKRILVIIMDGESFISANGTEIIDKQFSSIDVTINDEESVVVLGSSFADCIVYLKDVQNLEISNCTFKHTSFVISLDDPAIFVENCYFDGCEFKLICITGLSNQSELVDNELNNCSLKEANIKSDISVLGGNIKNCGVSTFIGKLNMLMDLHVEDCKGSFVEIDCAVLKCEFVRSTVDDLKHVGKIG